MVQREESGTDWKAGGERKMQKNRAFLVRMFDVSVFFWRPYFSQWLNTVESLFIIIYFPKW